MKILVVSILLSFLSNLIGCTLSSKFIINDDENFVYVNPNIGILIIDKSLKNIIKKRLFLPNEKVSYIDKFHLLINSNNSFNENQSSIISIVSNGYQEEFLFELVSQLKITKNGGFLKLKESILYYKNGNIVDKFNLNLDNSDSATHSVYHLETFNDDNAIVYEFQIDNLVLKKYEFECKKKLKVLFKNHFKIGNELKNESIIFHQIIEFNHRTFINLNDKLFEFNAAESSYVQHFIDQSQFNDFKFHLYNFGTNLFAILYWNNSTEIYSFDVVKNFFSRIGQISGKYFGNSIVFAREKLFFVAMDTELNFILVTIEQNLGISSNLLEKLSSDFKNKFHFFHLIDATMIYEEYFNEEISFFIESSNSCLVFTEKIGLKLLDSKNDLIWSMFIFKNAPISPSISSIHENYIIGNHLLEDYFNLEYTSFNLLICRRLYDHKIIWIKQLTFQIDRLKSNLLEKKIFLNIMVLNNKRTGLLLVKSDNSLNTPRILLYTFNLINGNFVPIDDCIQKRYLIDNFYAFPFNKNVHIQLPTKPNGNHIRIYSDLQFSINLPCNNKNLQKDLNKNSLEYQNKTIIHLQNSSDNELCCLCSTPLVLDFSNVACLWKFCIPSHCYKVNILTKSYKEIFILKRHVPLSNGIELDQMDMNTVGVISFLQSDSIKKISFNLTVIIFNLSNGEILFNYQIENITENYQIKMTENWLVCVTESIQRQFVELYSIEAFNNPTMSVKESNRIVFISKSFILPLISFKEIHLSVSSHGFTQKSLIIYDMMGRLWSINKALFDARREVQLDQTLIDDSVLVYHPLIPLANFMSINKNLTGFRSTIFVFEHHLESTTILCMSEHQCFTVNPTGLTPFDALKSDFNKYLVVSVLALLIGGCLLARRLANNNLLLIKWA